MNKEETDMIIQTFILAMQGTPSYELTYQTPISPPIATIGLQAARFTQYLIKIYESEFELLKGGKLKN